MTAGQIIEKMDDGGGRESKESKSPSGLEDAQALHRNVRYTFELRVQDADVDG